MTNETNERLQDLIEINIDSYKGLRESAQQVDDANLKQLFNRFADDRERFAKELQGHVALRGKKPETSGSSKAKAHRWWIDVRSKFSDGPQAVLSEAERGEDQIKDLYENALKETAATSPVHEILKKQYEEVKRGHDTIRDLRDSEKNKS